MNVEMSNLDKTLEIKSEIITEVDIQKVKVTILWTTKTPPNSGTEVQVFGVEEDARIQQFIGQILHHFFEKPTSFMGDQD